MVHRDLKNVQLCPGSAHLHLEVPTVGRLFHTEFFECVAPNGAEWAHIGIVHAVKQPKQCAGYAAGKDLLEIHAARFAFAASPRTDHEILFAAPDWFDELRHELRTLASVTVEENDEVAFR